MGIKAKLAKIINMLLVFSLCLSAMLSCTPKNNGTGPDINNDKKIEDSLFLNPSIYDRPMVMLHGGFGQTMVNDIFQRGYGGIVTNVAWDNDYLQNSRSWINFVNSVKYAIDTKGMYLWIYDEYGYPSGTALGQTLKGNPEYEALGLVPQYKTIQSNSSGSIDLLYGHTEIVKAYVYKGSSKENMDLGDYTDISPEINSSKDKVTYTNRNSHDVVLVAYMSKPWYENTHSMENWYAQQRYVNLLDQKPAEKFINLTHEQYYEYVGEYFGKGIQAFFTDEPALQGNYFNITDRNRKVIDAPDPNFPIVESLNYSVYLFDTFKQVYGYEIEPYLQYLYNDDGSVKAKQVRMDFYALTSSLLQKNYFSQIANWCGAKNISSSGHLLLEEILYQNPWFEGNMLQLLGEMQIPGTDLLYSKPQTAMAAASAVSKMASSAADFNGAKNTFAEISGAFDGTAGNLYDRINAVGVQVAMGINTFASYYYQGNTHTKEEDKIFSDALGRMRYMVTGSRHDTKVAVYYPYEGVSAVTLPSLNMYAPADAAKEVSDSFNDLVKILVSKQVDYDLTDYINLAKCTVKEGALVAPDGERYTAIAIPYTPAINSQAVLKLIEAQNAGVEVILQDFDSVVCETGKNDVAARFAEIASKAKILTSANGIGNYLRDNGYTYAKINDDTAVSIYITKRQNKNYDLFTVVNAYETQKTYTFTLEGKGTKAKVYNPVEGTVNTVLVNNSNGKITFSYTLPADRTVFFLLEK